MRSTCMTRYALLLCLAALLLTACAGPRKCNGQRGVRTPMGVM